MGKVQFADGDDWVGVRLTGSAVGLGKNDGSVQGHAYFDCPPQCGLFVKKSSLSKRQLTRLEELRLRRELAQSVEKDKKPSTTPSKSRSPPRAASVSTPSSTSSSRLEEIRQRRAQLQGESSSSDLKIQIEQMTTTLKAKDTQIESLEKQVSKSKDEVAAKDTKVSELKDQVKKLQQQQRQQKAEEVERAAKRSLSSGSLQDSQLEIQGLQAQVKGLEEELKTLKKEAQQELEKERTSLKEAQVELTAARTEAEQLQKEMANLVEQSEVRGASDASHYKERAKLQAEVASLNRRVEQLELEKQESENDVEELTLDKEQLQEEKEALEDRLEELKLDTETAQMEVEELRMELEDAKASQEAAVDAAANAQSGGASIEAQDIAQSLGVQNTRLREALIRLREQSSVEKMDLSRQLRSAEKASEEAKALASEVENLRSLKTDFEEQISDLKDMVEQGSAYELMVEDLSDRVLSLEEELVAGEQTIREMEEAADITAEMEEVQADELKAVNRDLEDRETIIRNLEEAIKMQRKREEDFKSTVGNYRTMVETLKQEKKALLELHQGGEGEKSEMVSASQKALARAAQLVQDAAEMRKREAQAAVDRIDSQVRMHLSERLESLLPPTVASAEIASIKGELLLSKVVGKASLSLDGISRSFTKTIRARAWEWRSDQGETTESEVSSAVTILTDEQQQMAATMIHQSEVAHVAIDVSGDLLWLLSAGQWPDILGPEASAELGAIMGHSMSDLDIVLGNVLNTLKEEGVLSPHQSNIGAFRQTVVSTMQTLRSHIEQDGESLVPMGWKPPALKLFRDASRAKFSSLGCYAAVASVLNYGDSIKSKEALAKTQELVNALKPLLKKLDQAASEASKSCLRLAYLDVQDEPIVDDISKVADGWRAACDDLLGNVYNTLLCAEGLTPDNLSSCQAATDEVVRLVSQFASVLRLANLQAAEDQKFHPFSPEVADVWEGVTLLAKTVRSKDGDEDDINYLVRARGIEQDLEDAVEKEPKLALANAKITSLEKSLSSRSKEIAVQNARLAELEKLLAKTSAQPSPSIKSAQMTSSEAMNSLKQEIRVLTEAMDVLHRQVEEYESEIRFLKDAKTPKGRSRTPRRSFADRGGGDNMQNAVVEAHSGAFEAALFRPALQAARRDAAQWKAKATVSTLLELPSLHVSGSIQSKGEEEKTSEEDSNPLLQLSSALTQYRQETASIKVVDLSKPREGKPRSGLYDIINKKATAASELDKAAAVARRWLETHGSSNIDSTGKGLLGNPLLGRVKFAGPEPVHTVPTPTSRQDLYRLQLHLVQ